MTDNNAYKLDAKSLAEKELMEELNRGERSGDEQGYIDIDESKACLGV